MTKYTELGDRREERAVRHLARLAARAVAHGSRSARACGRSRRRWSASARARSGRPLVAGTIILPHFADSTEFVKLAAAGEGQARARLGAAGHLPPDRRAGRSSPRRSRARACDSARAALHARVGHGRNVRGTGYSLALGGGELGMRLEKAGVAGLLTLASQGRVRHARDLRDLQHARADRLAELRGLRPRLPAHRARHQARSSASTSSRSSSASSRCSTPSRRSPAPRSRTSTCSSRRTSIRGTAPPARPTTAPARITMLEAMRILKQAYPHPKRTIRVGHWTGEEDGLVGSKAYREDHPEVVAGTAGAVQPRQRHRPHRAHRRAGIPRRRRARARVARRSSPTSSATQIKYIGVGVARHRRLATTSPSTAPALPRSASAASNWNYGNVHLAHRPRHVRQDRVRRPQGERDARAMLAYLASEDPEKVTRERIDLASRRRLDPRARAPTRCSAPARPAARRRPRCRAPAHAPGPPAASPRRARRARAL